MTKQLEQCKLVLEKNWKGKFTIPSPRLYPFQWNWDSGFIAIGNSHLKLDRSILEIETLFSGQWENGFLPHILFHNADKYSSYFPSADYWNSSVSPFAPENLKTSGITQPPVHGFVLEHLFNLSSDKERMTKIFDKIVKYHEYLYDYREFNDSGLVSIWHNWESGMDNSVWWDDVLERIDRSKVENIELFRKDIHEVEESNNTRPKDLDYKRYLYLVNKLHDSKYERVSDYYPFQVLDPVFNTILLQSNKSLIKIGKEINRDTSFLQSQTEKGIENFSKYFWNENDSLYYPFDLISQNQINKHCSGCYIPIFAGIPSAIQIEKLVNHFEKNDNLIPIPSCFPDQKGFEKKNYWRGPVWVNMNWMVWKGLLLYGKDRLAEKIKNSTIKMVDKYGVYEYFDPYLNAKQTAGYGGANFSWTAALILDMERS